MYGYFNHRIFGSAWTDITYYIKQNKLPILSNALQSREVNFDKQVRNFQE